MEVCLHKVILGCISLWLLPLVSLSSFFIPSVRPFCLFLFHAIVLDPIKVFEGHKNLGHERPFEAADGIIFNQEPPAAVRTQL